MIKSLQGEIARVNPLLFAEMVFSELDRPVLPTFFIRRCVGNPHRTATGEDA